MSSINPSALLAAQVYGGAPAQRHAHHARPQAKSEATPSFQLSDSARSQNDETHKPERAASSAAQSDETREAPARPRRPGTLVDIKA